MAASPAERLRKQAFTRLNKASGENVTFRGSTLTAIVNREPERDAPDDRADFNHAASSSIEINKSDLGSKPEAGEVVTDANGDFHRIQKLRRITPFTYLCDATVDV